MRVLVLLTILLLTACNHQSPAEQPTTSSTPATTAVTVPDFCNPQRYPLRHIRGISHLNIDVIRGPRIPFRSLVGLNNFTLESDTTTYPFGAYYCAFQASQPNYCAFIIQYPGDDPTAEFYTYNFHTKKSKSLTVGAWWSGCDESHVAEGYIRCWPQQMSQFPNDTTVLLINRWTVSTLTDSKELQKSPFSIDSIVTRYTIRPDGTFKQHERDSVRLVRTGDPAKYNGVPRE